MTVKDIYETIDKTQEHWSINIFTDGKITKMNELAMCNDYYKVDTKNIQNPYSIKELFDKEITKMRIGYQSLYLEIKPFQGMKYRVYGINKDGIFEDRIEIYQGEKIQ